MYPDVTYNSIKDFSSPRIAVAVSCSAEEFQRRLVAYVLTAFIFLLSAQEFVELMMQHMNMTSAGGKCAALEQINEQPPSMSYCKYCTVWRTSYNGREEARMFT